MTIPIATIDAAGCSLPSYSSVLAAVHSLYQSIYGSDIYIDTDSQDGQFLAALATAIDDTNQAAQAAYQSFRPGFSQGAALSSLVKINGITRLTSSYSTATGQVVGTVGTTITNGVVKDPNNNKWNLPTSVVIGAGGFTVVTITAQEPGNIVATTGMGFTIYSGQARGWQSFNLTVNSVAGTPVETDAELHARQTESVALAAQTPLEAMHAAIGNVLGVERLRVFENDTDATNSLGIPAHAICAVVQGGDATAIATAIASKKTPGCYTFGTTTIPLADTYGNTANYRYSPVTTVPITTTITIQALTGYKALTGELIKTVMAAWYNQLGIGDFCYSNKAWGVANLSGEVAVKASGYTQDELDALSASFNILAIAQSRATNISQWSMVGAQAAGSTTIQLASTFDLYFYHGQVIEAESESSGNITLVVGSVNYDTKVLTLLTPVPTGVTLADGGDVFLISDVAMVYNEAASGDVSNISVVVI